MTTLSRSPSQGRPLAVSLGDPAGIGAEIVAKAWAALRETGPVFMVVGDRDVLAAAAGRSATVRRVGSPDEAAAIFPDALPVLDLPLLTPVVAGKPSAVYAASILRWIETATGLVLSGAVSGLVTAPIAKKPLYEAGFGFPGHTEFLAELTARASYDGVRGPVMMLTTRDGLRVCLATLHVPLRKALAELTVERIVHTARVAAEALRRDFGLARPRLALAGLNPHAGEDGAMGSEEIELINPAAERLRGEGIDCSDARSADTLFHEAARRTYDAAICMYHDQALIPIKTLDFWGGVNITLGLPIVRTSPDHGVGYDIAGRGLARADSMIAALHAARQLAGNRTGALKAA